MPDHTDIRLASDARCADLADDIYNLAVDAWGRIDKAYQAEREAHLATLDLLAKAEADPGAATDACRFLGCSAANLLATVTSLYETRGGLVSEVADLRAKLAADIMGTGPTWEAAFAAAEGKDPICGPCSAEQGSDIRHVAPYCTPVGRAP